VVPGLADAQCVHSYVSWSSLFVYVPLCLGRRDLLETQLIWRCCPALNVHKQLHDGRPIIAKLSAGDHHLRRRSRRHKPWGLVQQCTLVTYTCHAQEYVLLYNALLEETQAGSVCVSMRKRVASNWMVGSYCCQLMVMLW
jgi:hypothetical protein